MKKIYRQIKPEDLPESMRELVNHVGLCGVLQLIAKYGGNGLYVPSRYSPNHPLVALVGDIGFRALCYWYGGDELKIPAATTALRRARNRQIVGDYLAGKSNRQLAKKYRLGIRAVEGITGSHTNERQVPAPHRGGRQAAPTAPPATGPQKSLF